MNTSELFERVDDRAPGFAQAMAEHVADNGRVLPHVLMGDLGRYVESYFTANASVASKIPAESELRGVLALLGEGRQA